jgi:hypothetical protein
LAAVFNSANVVAFENLKVDAIKRAQFNRASGPSASRRELQRRDHPRREGPIDLRQQAVL